MKTLLGICIVLCVSACTMCSYSNNTPSFAVYMSHLERYADKLRVSIDHKNPELSEYYLQELYETTMDLVSSYPYYKGHQIDKLATSALFPVLDEIKSELRAEPVDFKLASNRFKELIAACNSCHISTNYGFIKIAEKPGAHQYLQLFRR